VGEIDTQSERNGEVNGAPGMRPGVIAGGGILLALGATMLLGTTGAVDVPIGRVIGPAVLIFLGVVTMTDKGGIFCGDRRPGGRRRSHGVGGRGASGLWLIGIGVWMLISQMHLWGFTYATSWPLIVILSGIVLLGRGIR
jgi:hypothetical protein